MDARGPYISRNKRLAKLGYDSYYGYLDSPEWKAIRARVLARDGGLCVACGAEAKAVHHSSYTGAAITGRCITAMFSLCHDCHSFIEFNEDGQKLHLNEVRARLRQLCLKHGRTLPGFCKRCLRNVAPRGYCKPCKRKRKAGQPDAGYIRESQVAQR